jgi:hypothetical protein
MFRVEHLRRFPMLVVHDYECIQCKHREERLVERDEADRQVHVCPEGDDEYRFMQRLVSATRTHFRFADGRLKR